MSKKELAGIERIEWKPGDVVITNPPPPEVPTRFANRKPKRKPKGKNRWQ